MKQLFLLTTCILALLTHNRSYSENNRKHSLTITADTLITNKWYDPHILNFKRKDSISFPHPGGIVFIGSSTITQWENMKDYFPKHHIIQRGFGGSGLGDIVLYSDLIITCYKPKQVVIYSGENDIISGKTSDQVVTMFKAVSGKIRARNPSARITYMSLKASPYMLGKNPANKNYTVIYESSNKMIKSYLTTLPNTSYIDIYTPLSRRSKRKDSQLYKSDGLHLNEKGRQLITPIITKKLLN